jgi:hypothetical protein
VWVDGKSSGTAAQTLRLSLAAGSAEIEARMPGFRPAKTSVNLAGGSHAPISLTLEPVLTLKVLFSGEGRIAINNEEPVKVQDGQFLRDLSRGTYAAKISTGRTGAIAFQFEVRADGPAVITGPPATQDVSALLVSNFGDQTRIYGGASPINAKFGDQALGKLDKNGLDLPKLGPAKYDLELGDGKEVRKKSIEIGPDRTLTVIIDSDPNTGTLLVQTSESNVTISVLAGAREVAHGQSQKGAFRAPSLKAGKYVVRASKEGFDTDVAEQAVEIQKGEDKTITFQFRPRPMLASARIRLTAGSELFLDGTSQGTTQEESRVVANLKPGSHTFRGQKKQFQANQKSADFAAGQTVDIDLRLSAAPVPVEIKRNPVESTVTYTRAGDSAIHTFTGTHQDLPEGDYKFTARAKGYLETNAQRHVSWDAVQSIDLTQAPESPPVTLADWGKGAWTSRGGATEIFERAESGVVLFPKRLGTGYVQFMISWEGGKTSAQWLLGYVNEKSYVRCEIDDSGFQAVRVSDGKTDILVQKKPVSKSQWYPLRIEARPDGVTISLQNGKTWDVLAELRGTGFADAKFGFNVAVGQRLFISGFDGRLYR